MRPFAAQGEVKTVLFLQEKQEPSPQKRPQPPKVFVGLALALRSTHVLSSLP